MASMIEERHAQDHWSPTVNHINVLITIYIIEIGSLSMLHKDRASLPPQRREQESLHRQVLRLWISQKDADSEGLNTLCDS